LYLSTYSASSTAVIHTEALSDYWTTFRKMLWEFSHRKVGNFCCSFQKLREKFHRKFPYSQPYMHLTDRQFSSDRVRACLHSPISQFP